MSIETITAHRTSDGAIHVTHRDAVAHEMSLKISIGVEASRRIVANAELVRELLSQLDPPATADDTDRSDWKEWNGTGSLDIGDCRVEVRFRDGNTDEGRRSDYEWSHHNNLGDIVAWRPAQ